MAGRRRRTIWWVVALAAAVAVVAVIVRARLVPDSHGAWLWVERLSWFTGVLALFVAVVALRRDTAVVVRPPAVGGGRHVIDPRTWAPNATSIDPPADPIEELVRGRQQLVEAVVAAQEARGEPRAHVLHGLGGSGKTTVALMLARRARRRRASVWWISAATTTDLHTGMHHLAARLGATENEIDRAWSGIDSATDLLWRLLENHSHPWFLVVDNADDPEVLAAEGRTLSAGTGWLRPPASRHGFVLVTSRNGDPEVWGSWCRLHLVPMLSSSAGAQILVDRAGPSAGSTEEAEALASRLGGLPLALRLVGSYLAEMSTVPWPTPTATFAGYQAAMDSEGLDDLFHEPPGPLTAEQSRTVIQRTWDLSLDQLHRRGMPQARPLLQLLSCFAEAPIPYEVVLHPETLATSSRFPDMNAARLWQLLKGLDHLGLVEITPGNKGGSGVAVVSIHPLVRRVSRLPGRDADAASFLSLAAALLGRVAETEREAAEDPRRWPVWEALAPHALHVLQVLPARTDVDPDALGHAAFATQLAGQYLRSRGLRGASRTFHQAVLDTCRPPLGDQHISVLAARHSLAALKHAAGEYDTAEAEYREILRDREQALGADHTHTLATRHMLAFLLWDRGHVDEAESGFREVLAATLRVTGPDHLLAVNARSLLARVLERRGELDEAEQNQTVGLASVRRLLGHHHPRTLGARTHLAALHHARGDLDRAEAEYRDVLALQERILGADHPDSFRTRSQLALLLHDRGRLEAAARSFRAIVEAQRQVLGPGHPNCVSSRHRLGLVLRDQGDLDTAESVLTEVLQARETLLGAGHPDTVETREALAALRSSVD